MYDSAPERGADTGHTKRDSTTVCGQGWCAEPFTDVIRVRFSLSQRLNRSATVIEPLTNSSEAVRSKASVSRSLITVIGVFWFECGSSRRGQNTTRSRNFWGCPTLWRYSTPNQNVGSCADRLLQSLLSVFVWVSDTPVSIKRDAGAISRYARLGDVINGGKIPCWQQGPLWKGRVGTRPRIRPTPHFFRSGLNRCGGERYFCLLPLPTPAASETVDQRRSAAVPTTCPKSALCRTTATTGVQAA